MVDSSQLVTVAAEGPHLLSPSGAVVEARSLLLAQELDIATDLASEVSSKATTEVAQEQRKHDIKLVEAKWQQRNLDFLITQT